MIDSVVNDLPAGIARLESSKATQPAEVLGRQDFLRLLTTQLQNQNPLEPIQNEAFVAQLAQFSTLEATVSMSDSLARLTESMNIDRVLGGASIVGKSVAAPGGQATLSAGSPLEGTVSLPAGADNLQVGVYSPAGVLVRTLTLGSQLPGDVRFSWDGVSDAGEQMAPGAYRLAAVAMTAGQAETVAVTTFARVKAVSLDPLTQSMRFELDSGRTVGLSEVTKVGE